MGYVAVKGGHEAIEFACKLFEYERIKGRSKPIKVEQILEQLYFAVDRVMSEGSLYAPKLSALAIKQSAGDLLEASFILRAYRSTLPRVGYSLPLSTKNMRVIRRISAAFKDIPGGQLLGPTSDYCLRLFNFELLEEDQKKRKEFIKELLSQITEEEPIPESFPKVVEILRKENLLVEEPEEGREFVDITVQPLNLPACRSAKLQAMARGETGGLLLLAYSNMRGYGDIHPTIAELRVGYLSVKVVHPYTKEEIYAGEVKITEAELIAKYETKDGIPKFTLGYGACFGHNETKAIAMAVLDRATQTKEPKHPSEDQEFVLYHIDGIESMGFCNHYKMPHYITFQSDLDRLRKAQKVAKK
ncbi:carbon-phosphorus lyase complex subunit PhnI [Thermocrinis sp.]